MLSQRAAVRVWKQVPMGMVHPMSAIEFCPVTTPARYELDCTLSHEHQMVMFVRILTGLCELNARGVAAVALTAADASFPGDSTTLWMRVREHTTHASRRVA